MLLWACLWYLDREGLVPLALAACLLHELGHYAVLRLLGGRVSVLRVTCVGAEMRLSPHTRLGPGARLLAVLAGPAASQCAALAASRWGGGEWSYCFSGLNLTLGIFNLLPSSRLDGGRALECLLELLGQTERAQRWLTLVSALLGLGLLGAGCALLWAGQGNLTLFLVALWLLPWPNRDEKKKKRHLNSGILYGKIP